MQLRGGLSLSRKLSSPRSNVQKVHQDSRSVLQEQLLLERATMPANIHSQRDDAGVVERCICIELVSPITNFYRVKRSNYLCLYFSPFLSCWRAMESQSRWSSCA